MESGRWYLFSLLLHYISYIDVEVVIMAMLTRKNETSAQTPATKRDYNDRPLDKQEIKTITIVEE